MINVPYVGINNPRQASDLKLPDRSDVKPLPVVVSIHGVGWAQGNKRSGLARMVDLADEGNYAAVFVGYRPSGEAIWANQIHDCKYVARTSTFGSETVVFRQCEVLC